MYVCPNVEWVAIRYEQIGKLALFDGADLVGVPSGSMARPEREMNL